MILIVGSSNDDILYFESILKNKKQETILGQFTAYTGEIFNQSIMLLKDVYTSYITSAVVSHIIEKYLAILVIAVGRCQAFSDKLKIGDICICRQVICGDVNLSDTTNVAKGQIPGFPQLFTASKDIFTSLSDAISNRTFIHAHEATFVSKNYNTQNKEELRTISDEDKILGINGNIVLCPDIGGIAVASKIHDIPFASIQVVGTKIGHESTIKDYLTVLEQYANVGKTVVSVIGEIGRSDIVR